jgi:hypothetical protein
MEFGKGINIFIKNDSPGNINMTFCNVKTFKAFVNITISQEHTLFGTKLQFAGIVRSKIRPTCTPKSTKRGIIRLLMKKAL